MSETRNYIEDLIKVQSEIDAFHKDKANPFFSSKYVPLSDILKQVKPVLNKNGFLLTQRLSVEDGRETLKTEIIHSDSGIKLYCEAPLKMDDKDKNNPQKYGSAITYMRRYSLTSLLGLSEEDDDGNKAAGNKVAANKPIISKEFGESVSQDMKEVQIAENEKQFARIKKDVETCDSLEELQALWEKNKKQVNQLKKYAGDLYEILFEAKETMKISLGG